MVDDTKDSDTSTDKSEEGKGTLLDDKSKEGEQPPKKDGDDEQPPKKEAPTVPDKYELVLADGSELDADAVEKTATLARELGLSQEAAAKVFDHLQGTVGARVASRVKDYEPGGPVWQKQVSEWEAEALKDADIGGTPEALQENVKAAKQVLNKYFDKSVTEFLSTTGLGSHPGVIKGFAKLKAAFKEGTLVKSKDDAPAPKKDRNEELAEKFYSDKPSKKE